MKGDAVLDYVELQLTPSRTRCDLFVSADGVTEKLASGFLKPFLTNLQAVEEQVARGDNSVRLEHPQISKEYHRRSWFTKGTVERFVRFVSTPEVLERVKSVEDELAQLEQVRNIQASNLLQNENILLGANSTSLKTDEIAHSSQLENNASSKLPRNHQYNCTKTGVDSTKVELLRAMDLRLLALQQEQSTAFGRAAAAGFSSGNMAGLIAFSEHFGADRLCTACINFLAVFQSRHAEPACLDTEPSSSSSGKLLDNAMKLDVTLLEGPKVDMQKGRVHLGDEKPGKMDAGRVPGGMEARKRWGPLEDIRTQLYVCQNETDSASSNDTSNGVSVDGSPEVQSLIKKAHIVNMQQERQHDSDNPVLVHSLQAQADSNRGTFPKLLSPTRRSSLPIQKAQLESSGIHCEALIEEKSSTLESCRTSEVTAVDSVTFSLPVREPARRLSVQDAISLFENKQKRESFDSSGKQRPSKQENDKVSLEGANVSSLSSMTLRRGALDGSEAINKMQTDESFFKQEASTLGSSIKLTKTDSVDLLQVRRGAPTPPPPPVMRSSGKFSSSAHLQPCLPSVIMKSEAVASGKESHNHLEQLIPDTAHEALEGDWRKQFKLQLEKHLAKESLSLLKEGHQELESRVSRSKETTNFSNLEPHKSNNSGSPAIAFLGSTSREAVEKNDILLELKQHLPMQDIAGARIIEVNKGQGDPNSLEPCSSSLKKKEAINRNNTIPSSERESLRSASVNALDDDMHALDSMADNQAVQDDKDHNGLKGRFYEQYRKRRDAKLIEEQDSKRAERGAKLKVMEETLAIRKAELDARAVRLSKNSHCQARASKVEMLKADLHTPKKQQQDDQDESSTLIKNQRNPVASSASLPFPTCAIKEDASTSKPQGGRKAGVISQKGATPPRSSTRAIPSLSPKLTPRSTTGGIGNLRKSVVSSPIDNPLARSVPCFANLRKENTKPIPGRPLGSARVHPKSGGSGPTRGVNEAAPLEANINIPVCTNLFENGPTKEDKKLQSGLVRKSYATASDFKMLPMSNDDGVLAPLKAQRETRIEPSVQNKLRRSAIGPLQEAKPFLKKGRGIGPGAGAGMIKQKVSSAVDTVRSPDEEDRTPQNIVESNNPNGSNQVEEGVHDAGIVREALEVQSMNVDEVDASLDFGSTNHMEMEVIALHELEQRSGEDTCDVEPSPDDVFDTERTCHTISFPIDMETYSRYAVNFGSESDCNPMFDQDTLSLKGDDLEGLSQHDEDTTESLRNQLNASASSSFRATSLHEHKGAAFSPVQTSTSSPNSNVVRYMPSHALTLESPLQSPLNSSKIPLNSLKIQDVDVTQSNKKWVASQKSAMALQRKESAKGFKRLLKFARKSRTSEVSGADCISASTTSEGDDESEEQSRFGEEVCGRGRLQEGRFNDVAADQDNAKEEGSTAQGVRSSIPTPPANFRLRDDHLNRDSMLKVPRSFFSLSSFRSKGSEGKSR